MSTVTIEQAMTLALQHHQAGRLDQAEAIYRQILIRQSDNPDALNLLGVLSSQKGEHREAVELINRAITVNPRQSTYHNNLGNVLKTLNRTDDAIAAYNSALKLAPSNAQAQNNLGVALNIQGRHQEALEALQSALRLNPGYAEAHYNLANSQMALGELDSAIGSFQAAIQLRPDLVQAYNNLANALKEAGRIDEAIAACSSALKINPSLAEPYNNMGNSLKDLGRVDEALAAYRCALKLQPDFYQAKSNLAYTLHFQTPYDAQAVYETHTYWNRQYAEPLKKFIQPHAHPDPYRDDPERRLKIGYVSADFREHSVAFFFENLLSAHDPEQVEIFCYADLPRSDQTSSRLQRHAHQWRIITGINDRDTAELIRRDGIDILVDLAGHTGGNRLMVLARKPAPVQVTYLGYPDTTGLSVMDYRFTDAYADPPGMTEGFYTEQLVRLEPTFLCYRPPEAAPPATAVDRGGVSFGCFNALAKINRNVVNCWAQIMRQQPESRLLVKNLGLSDADARRRLQEDFAACGIGPERLDLRGKIPSNIEHLQLYNQITIALDTFPYNGTTTTCEALWMGVPVVVLAGQYHMSRVGVSLLSNLGLQEMIAGTPEQYVQIAVRLANDRSRLAELRGTLRQRIQASPLMDAPRFARNVEAVYREMWHRWCGTVKPPARQT
jgi:protein O-GlcNAc transferase